jgi:hypothetical protein
MAETAYSGETPMKSSQLAAADLSSDQFKAVTVGTTGVSLVASQGAGQIKVLTNKPILGQACNLVDLGETKLVAGAAVAKGALLMTDSSARFITYVNNGVNVPVGECRVPASVAGDIFTGLIWPTPAAGGATEGAIADGLTAAADGLITDAVQLVNGWNRLSTVAGSADSAILPLGAPGMEVVVINDGAAAAQIFASGSDTIDAVNGQSTGVPLTNAKRAIFYCLTAGRWQSLMGIKSA